MMAEGVQETSVVEAATETKGAATEDKNRETETAAGAETETRRRRPTTDVGDAVFCRPLEVVVRDDRIEQAIRQLKNRMAREGVLRELKNRRHFFKPSELKRIKSREAARRRRKQARQKSSR
jgi:small subunit ribosomal protein S21